MKPTTKARPMWNRTRFYFLPFLGLLVWSTAWIPSQANAQNTGNNGVGNGNQGNNGNGNQGNNGNGNQGNNGNGNQGNNGNGNQGNNGNGNQGNNGNGNQGGDGEGNTNSGGGGQQGAGGGAPEISLSTGIVGLAFLLASSLYVLDRTKRSAGSESDPTIAA